MAAQTIQQINRLILPTGKKAYFASDFHLGLYPLDKSAERERTLVRWLDTIKLDAGALFLVGDIFDFWYEYKSVVPRGYVRFLSKIAEFTDAGIPVYFFTGNHDVWAFDYLKTEVGASVFYSPIEIEINDRVFVVGHGDGVGPGDSGYKIMRWCFHNPFLQFLFSRLHPNFAYWLGQSWSKHSRYSKGIADTFHGIDKEFNILFANEYLKSKPIDYFVFGHRHIPMDIRINDSAKLFNLGEWIFAQTFAVFDGQNVKLETFRKTDVDKIEYVRI